MYNFIDFKIVLRCLSVDEALLFFSFLIIRMNLHRGRSRIFFLGGGGPLRNGVTD